MEKNLVLSTLPHTWIFDIDGTLVKHNGYMTPEGDTLLDGVAEFLASIPAKIPDQKILEFTFFIA